MRYRSAGLAMLVLLVLVMGSHSTQAQEANPSPSTDAPSTYGWMGGHLGPTVSGGIVGRLGLFNHVRPPHLFRARLAGGDVAGHSLASDAEVYSGVELLYGRTTTWKLGRASLAGGLAVGRIGALLGTDGSTMVGVPLEATVQLTRPELRSVGVEIGVHANVNPERSFAGVSIGLVVGTLR